MQRRDRVLGDVGTQAKKNCKEVSLDYPPSPPPPQPLPPTTQADT